MWRFKCGKGGFFLKKKPLSMGAFPLLRLENRYRYLFTLRLRCWPVCRKETTLQYPRKQRRLQRAASREGAWLLRVSGCLQSGRDGTHRADARMKMGKTPQRAVCTRADHIQAGRIPPCNHVLVLQLYLLRNTSIRA
jgi:hypothetical protein